MGVSSAVIGSGEHMATVCSDWLWCVMTMVAMVDNASGIRKASLK